MLLWQRVLTLLSSAIAADSAVRMTLGITEHREGNSYELDQRSS